MSYDKGTKNIRPAQRHLYICNARQQEEDVPALKIISYILVLIIACLTGYSF